MPWQSAKEDLPRQIRFKCPKLEEHLGPALRPGNVIEISGQAGSAKTQFCLHLALQALRDPGHVLYIVTERAFPTKRLQQLLFHSGLSLDLMDRIIVKKALESAKFVQVVEKNILDIATSLKIKFPQISMH